jgi:Domain of unknown function (DUF4834)
MKFLIILILLFLLFRLVMPHLLRWALKAFVKKSIRNGTFMYGQGPFTQPRPGTQARPEAEGQVKVDYIPDNGSTAQSRDFRGGEYVDYEEVK